MPCDLRGHWTTSQDFPRSPKKTTLDEIKLEGEPLSGGAAVTPISQLTTSELNGLVGHASALTAMREALPGDLFTKLDTYLADLQAEQEDRVSVDLESRRAAKADRSA
jgi:hypothetical protein